MNQNSNTLRKAYYHLPGLFEFTEFYKVFLPLFTSHRDYFYDWCDIGSIYGAPADCIWGGGRVGYGDCDPTEVCKLMADYGISARLTFSNSLLDREHLSDKRCNALCSQFHKDGNGIIIYSDLLMEYIREKYPDYYFVSSTTKVLTSFEDCRQELGKDDYRFVVPDFRLNHRLEQWSLLSQKEKDKIELLCNECCDFACSDRKACYENVSRKCLGEEVVDHNCKSAYAKEGYTFSRAMESPAFIGIDEIQEIYLPMGIQHFKVEGRSLGSALLLEFLLYYMTKPKYQLKVREAMYLDSMLDLF